MEEALATLDSATLQSQLTDCLTAAHLLATGEREVSVSHGDTSVTYTQAKYGILKEHISNLQKAIKIKSGGGSSNKPITVYG